MTTDKDNNNLRKDNLLDKKDRKAAKLQKTGFCREKTPEQIYRETTYILCFTVCLQVISLLIQIFRAVS